MADRPGLNRPPGRLRYQCKHTKWGNKRLDATQPFHYKHTREPSSWPGKRSEVTWDKLKLYNSQVPFGPESQLKSGFACAGLLCSPVTYHAVVAVRYPNLCRLVNDMWELGSFASGGLPDRPPGFQLVMWDTDSKITGLVAADLETIVGHIIPDFTGSTEFADGLFVMTTATDHKNNLNRSGLKRDNARQLRVETIANSAGGTVQVAIVAQPSTGFLNGRFYADKSPTEDTEDCLARITVGLTRSKSLTVLVSPLDMLGLMGMAQVVAAIAYGIRGLRRGDTTWEWPDFHQDPTQENLGQITRWSLNQAPDWTYPPLAIANKYKDRHTKEIKRERYRLILVRGYELEWLRQGLLREIREGLAQGHEWIPKQDLPFTEIVLYAYAAVHTIPNIHAAAFRTV